MRKMHSKLATIDATLAAMTAQDMNHIRGGMATMDAEKTKKITHNGVRNGHDKDWKEEKIKKIKEVKV